MRFSSLIRLTSGVLLLCAMSSFSGCEKEGVSPTSRKDCKPKTTTSSDTTATGGAS